MLTSEALYQRRWGPFQQLGKLLEGRPLGLTWTGLSSISRNPFVSLDDLLHVYAALESNRNVIRAEIAHHGDVERAAEARGAHSSSAPDGAPSLRDELSILERALQDASDGFASFARQVNQLRHMGSQ